MCVGPFARLPRPWRLIFLQTPLDVVEALTSLKCLKCLHFNLFRRTALVDPNINDIATKLRNANSCFSCLEILEGGEIEWKSAISVWNEVFGVFHSMDSASAWYYRPAEAPELE